MLVAKLSIEQARRGCHTFLGEVRHLLAEADFGRYAQQKEKKKWGETGIAEKKETDGRACCIPKKACSARVRCGMRPRPF
jgi:hypothetical protein